MENYMDLDIYGREDKPGIAKELLNEDAIKNALVLWLTSKKGEFLYRPETGGVINSILFRPLNNQTINLLRFHILNEINIKFFPAVKLTRLELTPDTERRILKIEIEYEGLISKELEKVEFYTKTNLDLTNYTYTEIDYVEDNLYEFCVNKKDSMEGAKLLYDTVETTWVWGNFKLINLTPVDSRFTEILAVCNT